MGTRDWDVTSGDTFTFEPENNDGGVFALSPPDAASGTSRIFPPGYQSLVGGSRTYLLGIDSGEACKTAAEVLEEEIGNTIDGPRKYADGILCRRPARRLNVWTRGLVTATAPDMTIQVYQDANLVSEGVVQWWKVAEDGQTLKQGFPMTVVLGEDLRYSLSLSDGTDVPSDWVVEFSDPIMGNRFGVETIHLDIQGRECGVVTSQHDRRYIDGNQGGDPAMFGTAAVDTPPTYGGTTPSSFSCDVTCIGLVFTASVAEGQDVCEASGCGSGAPFVGLNSFGYVDARHLSLLLPQCSHLSL